MHGDTSGAAIFVVLGALPLLGGGWLMVARLLMRERCVGTVVDGWANPDGGDRPIVLFTTPQGALVKFMGAPDMGRFGANIGDAVAVRYNANRLEGLGVRPGEHQLISERLPMSVARIDTLRGSWTGPGTLMLLAAALMCPGLLVLAGA